MRMYALSLAFAAFLASTRAADPTSNLAEFPVRVYAGARTD